MNVVIRSLRLLSSLSADGLIAGLVLQNLRLPYTQAISHQLFIFHDLPSLLNN